MRPRARCEENISQPGRRANRVLDWSRPRLAKQAHRFRFSPRCPCRCKTLYAFRKTHFGFHLFVFHNFWRANARRATSGATRSQTCGIAFGFASGSAEKSSTQRFIGRGGVSSAARSAGLIRHAHGATTTSRAATAKSAKRFAHRACRGAVEFRTVAMENGAPIGFGHFLESSTECATLRAAACFRLVAANPDLRWNFVVD